MHSSRTIRLGLALTGLCALGVAAARPAAAQNLLYTLSGVTFADGATASGFFNANPTTGVFGALDITTTNGLTDGLLGKHYVLPATSPYNSPYFAFSFLSGLNEIVLSVGVDDRIPGVQPLQPGSFPQGSLLTNSGEFATPVTGGSTVGRAISAGSLVATGAPVPEASTTVSFGLLLALGLGGLVIAAKRKKAHATL